jgi:hypothetical protein
VKEKWVGSGKANAAHVEVPVTLHNVAGLTHEGDPPYIDPRIPSPVRALLRLLHAAEAGLVAAGAIESKVTRYVRGPRALLRSRALYVESARTVSRTEEHRIPQPALAALTALERAVMSAGFGAPHRITHGNPVELRSVGALLEHAGTGDLANINCMVSGTPDAARLSTTVSYVTQFTDGHRLVTSNSGVTMMWPPQPGHEVVRFPGINDARELYALHRCRVEERARTVPVRPATRGANETERLGFADRESQAFQRHLIQIGYREPAPDGLRHTVRGATLSAWRTMWPWKQWTDAAHRRRARAVMRARARAMKRG